MLGCRFFLTRFRNESATVRISHHSRVARRFAEPEYLADQVPQANGTPLEVHIPNVVTTVLASYRGYDTLGETVVIFTAAIGVLAILRGPRRRRDEREP